MSLFLYGLEVWASAYQRKYLDRIDTFFRRAYRFGYTTKIILISDVITNRDSDLFNRITNDTGHADYITCSLLNVLGLLEKGDVTLYFPK